MHACLYHVDVPNEMDVRVMLYDSGVRAVPPCHRTHHTTRCLGQVGGAQEEGREGGEVRAQAAQGVQGALLQDRREGHGLVSGLLECHVLVRAYLF